MRPVTRKYSWWPEAFQHSGIDVPKFAALAILLGYVGLAVIAYDSTVGGGSLSVRVGLCGETPCISWVMPAGQGWKQGVRPGMPVQSVDGREVSRQGPGAPPLTPDRQVTLGVANEEAPTSIQIQEHPIGQSPMKFSLWLLGATFALLGAAVVLRRPDLHSARMFGIFAALAALGLAVGPSAGGPGPPWALIIEFLMLVGVSASLLLFVMALVSDSTGRSWFAVLAIAVAAGLAIIGAYAVSVLAAPTLYDQVRPALFLFMAGSILVSLGLLAVMGSRQRSPTSRVQARVSLFGMAAGMLPFALLTLVPEALGFRALPSHITILALVLMPAAFAYAILQHQLLGIRRLVHRGMVYGIATLAALLVIALGLMLAMPAPGVSGSYSPFVIAGILVVGIVLFSPMRNGARWLVNRLIYNELIDYRVFIQDVNQQLFTSAHTPEIAQAIAHRLQEALQLESVLLFLGPEPARADMIAAAGSRAEEVLRQIHPQLDPYIARSEQRGLMEVQWKSESLMIVTLSVGERYLGYVLLGPKDGGEVFVEDEKLLVTTVAPLLAVTIDKSQLSEELRDLNMRLVKAEEGERARIAGDLHDGPLQKAILLTRETHVIIDSPESLARQLVRELREICSRLRPAILDDLGAISALDWLMDDVARRSGLATRLSIGNVDEDQRFSPDIELALFRITQEAANNAMKHSQGTSLEVSLCREGDNLVLLVADDGRGFSTAPLTWGSPGQGGFGLPGMRERVIQLDGSFEIRSALGLGTKVIARIPFDQWLNQSAEVTSGNPSPGLHR